MAPALLIQPGAHGRDLTAIAREVLERAGQPTLRTLAEGQPLPDHGFLHGFGHGVGLAGDEDVVLVTEDGAEVLTDFPYDLEPPGRHRRAPLLASRG